ncbi:MAG: DUF4294 domain-containing protein [Bacteroidales bacterium]|nr:DUF4294 domain-containing protein [Bacteroidales bacterium]
MKTSNSRKTRKLMLLAAAMLLMAQFCRAQQVKADAQTDRDMTGNPIVSHSKFYTGMVEYEGEMIPSFLYSDFYVFKPLVFKSPSQAKKYYKIANNIKKVYPLACEIQETVNRTIAHMDSLPTKKEKDAYLKQQEKDLKAEYYPKLKKLSFAQGKLLIKLIDRQCDMTGYELIKKYMGGFKAGFYNAFASLFGASLKKEYDPDVDDRLTERAILLIESGQM